MHNVAEISVSQLKSRLEKGEDLFLLDVREPFEHEIANLGGLLIPLGDLPARLHEIDKGRDIIVYCHHGNRSRNTTEFLQGQGFRSVTNLAGGIDAWSMDIDPKVPRY